jgi:hypothetical protein
LKMIQTLHHHRQMLLEAARPGSKFSIEGRETNKNERAS